MYQLFWVCLQRWVVGWGCEQESRQPSFLTQQGSVAALAMFMAWLMGHHWLQEDYSLHHSWMWVLLFLCPLKRSQSLTGFHTKFPAFPGLTSMEKVHRTQKGRWEQPQLLPLTTKLVSPESLPAVLNNSGVWFFFHRAVKNQWDLCCKLIIMKGKALQWNWFV